MEAAYDRMRGETVSYKQTMGRGVNLRNRRDQIRVITFELPPSWKHDSIGRLYHFVVL